MDKTNFYIIYINELDVFTRSLGCESFGMTGDLYNV